MDNLSEFISSGCVGEFWLYCAALCGVYFSCSVYVFCDSVLGRKCLVTRLGVPVVVIFYFETTCLLFSGVFFFAFVGLGLWFMRL